MNAWPVYFIALLIVTTPIQAQPPDDPPFVSTPELSITPTTLSPSTQSVPTAVPSPTTLPADDFTLGKPITAATQPAIDRATGPRDTDANQSIRPGPDNTGPADQKNLKISQKINATDGQVIENRFISGMVFANDTKNVIIRNCVIDGQGAPYGVQCQGAENILIERCEIYNIASSGIYGDGYTARGNVIYQSGGDGMKAGQNVLIEGNWIHSLGWKTPKAHADGVQIRAGSGVKIIGNFFDIPNDVRDTKSNAAVFIQGVKNKGGSSDILVEGNWCSGGNFTIHAFSDGDDAKSIRIVNNRFLRGTARYGVGRMEDGVTWRGNVFDEDDRVANPKDK